MIFIIFTSVILEGDQLVDEDRLVLVDVEDQKIVTDSDPPEREAVVALLRMIMTNLFILHHQEDVDLNPMIMMNHF